MNSLHFGRNRHEEHKARKLYERIDREKEARQAQTADQHSSVIPLCLKGVGRSQCLILSFLCALWLRMDVTPCQNCLIVYVFFLY